MPSNPDRASRGGDCSGTTKTDGLWGVGAPISVAEASYDAGYDEAQKATMEAGYVTLADVKAGYCSYGVATGEKRVKGIIG